MRGRGGGGGRVRGRCLKFEGDLYSLIVVMIMVVVIDDDEDDGDLHGVNIYPRSCFGACVCR